MNAEPPPPQSLHGLPILPSRRDIVHRIKQIRRSSGISQTELARHSSLSQPAISLIESEKERATYDNLSRLCNGLQSLLIERYGIHCIYSFGKPLEYTTPSNFVSHAVNLIVTHGFSFVPVFSDRSPKRIQIGCIYEPTVRTLFSGSNSKTRLSRGDVKLSAWTDLIGNPLPEMMESTDPEKIEHEIQKHGAVLLRSPNAPPSTILTWADLPRLIKK